MQPYHAHRLCYNTTKGLCSVIMSVRGTRHALCCYSLSVSHRYLPAAVRFCPWMEITRLRCSNNALCVWQCQLRRVTSPVQEVGQLGAIVTKAPRSRQVQNILYLDQLQLPFKQCSLVFNDILITYTEQEIIKSENNSISQSNQTIILNTVSMPYCSS